MPDLRSRWSVLCAVGVALAAAGFVGACRQVLGVETRSEGGGGEHPSLSLGDACDACVAETCQAEERACAGDAACTELVECLTDAGIDHPIGRRACASQYPEGLAAASYDAIDQCVRLASSHALAARGSSRPIQRHVRAA